MANMTLGGYTFSANPSDMPVIKAKRHTGYVKTYSSAAFFSWGTILPGTEVFLEWTYMPGDMFESLDALLAADTQVVFDPQDGSGLTFNVEILNLDAKHFLKFGTDSGTLKKDVKMLLLIVSEIGP